MEGLDQKTKKLKLKIDGLWKNIADKEHKIVNPCTWGL